MVYNITKLEKVSLLFLIIFGIFGFSIFSTMVHEFVHYFDFKEYDLEDEGMCVANIPLSLDNFWNQPAGYYEFTAKNMTDYNNIQDEKYSSEIKATIAEGIVYFLGFLLIIAITNIYFKTKWYIIKNEDK